MKVFPDMSRLVFISLMLDICCGSEDAEIPPPVNMTVLRIPLGILVSWKQPNTSLQVMCYRVYHRQAGIDHSDVWIDSDTNRTAIHISLAELSSKYDVKIQTMYSNGVYSRNVSATGQHPHNQRQRANSGTNSVRDSDSNNVGDNDYESINSNDIDDQGPLPSTLTSNEATYNQPYTENELGRLTTPKVVYTDDSEAANYIHPVHETIDSSEYDAQYVQGRIPEDHNTNYIHPVAELVNRN
ncbi:uncharacterized protein LOC123542311 isoform X3 [Mercenaria mercenaria]|uniref:uncharacterized protein LOC123542311 isoform X3 n=1 Tax=Mercenaria mercenaria TaxID=6596 RepID=UPI00234F6EB1|nr:uncharacterized protein LOC123542311 isoform X3 [Mercenaria mercenaria]